MSVIKESHLKMTPGVPTFEAIETDTDRSVTYMYDFPLKLHSNHGPISYRFRYKRRFLSKIGISSTPCIYNDWLKAFPLELGIGACGQKPRVMVLPGRGRRLTTSAARWIQYTNVTDGQMDGRTTTKTAFTHSLAR